MSAAVLVLTHNSASYIAATLAVLQTALASTRLVDSVRIYDDASTDRTCDVVQRVWTSSIPLRISRATLNLGEGANCNRGFQDLRNDGISWAVLLHADDRLIPGWLEKAFHVIATRWRDTGMVCCNTRYFKAATPSLSEPLQHTYEANEWSASLTDVAIYDGGVDTIRRLKKEWFWNVSGSVINTERYCRIGGFLNGLTYAGDNDFLVRFLLDGNDVAYVRTPFIIKYHHPLSMTLRLISTGEYAIGWSHLMLRHLRFATKCERTQEFWQSVALALRRAIAASIRKDTATVRGQWFAIRILIRSWMALFFGLRVLLPNAVRALLETPHVPL